MFVGDRQIRMLPYRARKTYPGRPRVDVVAESTGRYTNRERLPNNLEAGAKRVVISAPAKTRCHVRDRVNEDQFDPARHFIISNASCTTNCLAPSRRSSMTRSAWKDGFMTTVHAYTDDQNLVDALHKDARRSRRCHQYRSTTTGAAKATGLVMPNIAGHLDGLALTRFPFRTRRSLIFVAIRPRDSERRSDKWTPSATARDVRRLAGVLEYSDEPLVSSDIITPLPRACFDSGLTMARGHLVKVLGWYDNESGYSSRLATSLHSLVPLLIGSTRDVCRSTPDIPASLTMHDR